MTSLNFRRAIAGAARGEVIIPVLRAALWQPNLKSFDITLPDFSPRKPDGWFHPSEHPLWPERMLYWYALDPANIEPEPFDPHSTMAVTQGHFWHEFIQKVGVDQGILREPSACACGRKHREWYVEDGVLKSRGHMDGVVNSEVASVDLDEVFEFKTMRPSRFRKLPQNVDPTNQELLTAWRAMVPEYYAQAQEYLRMSGYRRHRTLVLSMEYPFDMMEIVVDFDHGFAHDVEEKYRRVRQAVADHTMPEPCCAPGSKTSKTCPARLVCPIAAMLR